MPDNFSRSCAYSGEQTLVPACLGTENTLPVFQVVREKNSAGPWDWEDGEEAVYVCD